MKFGWYGFRLDPPDEFAPIAFRGGRREGYVRLDDGDEASLMLRWKEAPKRHDLGRALDEYFARLRRDAKKEFSAERTVRADGIAYRYRGKAFGRGRVFFSPARGRVVIAEAVSPRSASAADRAEGALASLVESPPGAPELWALLGAAASLPPGFDHTTTKLFAGRSELSLRRGRSVAVVARWGLAETLLAERPFEDWAIAAMGFSRPQIVAGENTLALEERRFPFPAQRGLARIEHSGNEIRTLVVRGHGAPEPDWRWFDS